MENFGFVLTSAVSVLALPTFTCSSIAFGNPSGPSGTHATGRLNWTPSRPETGNRILFTRQEETVDKFETFRPQYDLGFYDSVSRQTGSNKTLLDASLFLSMEILKLKSEVFMKFVLSNKATAAIILSDLINDIRKIGELAISYNNLNKTFFNLTNFYHCITNKKILKHNIMLVTQTIEKKVLLKELQNSSNSELGKNLKKDMECKKNRSESFAFGSFSTFLKYTEDNAELGYNKRLLGCENNLKQYNEVLKEFEMFLSKYDFSNESVIVGNYNKCILKFAAADFPLKNFDNVKKYFDFIIETGENFHINYINEVCSGRCALRRVTSLILLLDRFPLANSSVAAVNHLFGVKMGSEYNWTKEILFICTIINKWSSDPALEYVENNLRREFFLVRRLVYRWAETYKSKLAYHVSKYDEDPKHIEILRDMLNFKKIRSRNYNSLLVYEYIVKYLYNIIIPDKFNNIYSFINSKVKPFRVAMYRKLLDIMMDNINNSNEILRLAYHVKAQGDEGDLKDKLPSQVKQVVWNKECFLRNVAYNDYLILSEPYFTNVREREFVGRKDYLKSALGLYNKTFKWYLDYDHINNTFSIRDRNLLSYLAIGKRFPVEKYHLSDHKRGEDEYEMKWRLKIRTLKSKQNNSNKLVFQLLSSDEPTLGIYASRNKLDRKTRSIFVSNLTKTLNGSYWNIICPDLEYKKSQQEEKRQSSPRREARGIGDESFFEEIKNDSIGNEIVDEILFSFLEKINFKRFLSTNSTGFPPSLAVYRASSRFTKNALTFFNLQLLELMEFSTYTKELDVSDDLLIQNILGSMSGTLTVYGYLLNNVSDNAVDEFDDLCEEAIGFMKANKGFWEIGRKISNTSTSNQYFKTSINLSNIILPSTSKFSEYFSHLEKDNECWKGRNVFRYNLESRIDKSLLIKITEDSFINLQFHVGALYFTLINNESVIFEIFEKLLDNHFCNKDVYNSFAVFFNYLLTGGYIVRLEKAADFIFYSFIKLKSSSLLTETLRKLYNLFCQQMRSITWYRNITLSYTAIFNLENIMAEKTSQIMKLSELALNKDLNYVQLSHLARHVEVYYSNDDVSRLIIYMFNNQTDKTNFKFYNFYFFSRFPRDFINYAFDGAIRSMLLRGKENNTQAIKFAEYVYKNSNYIPCYHTGCVDDLESIRPGHVKGYINGKACRMQDSKFYTYLFASKFYFVNEESGGRNKWLTIESRRKRISNDWTFEHVKENDNFLMKSRELKQYVGIGKRLGNSDDYTLVLAKNTDENLPVQWKVELRKNSRHYSNRFTLRAFLGNEKILHMAVARYDYRSELGTVILSEQKSPDYSKDMKIRGHGEIWDTVCE